MRYVSYKMNGYEKLYLLPDGSYHPYWDRAKQFDQPPTTGLWDEVPVTPLEMVQAGLIRGEGCEEQVVFWSTIIDGDHITATLQDGTIVRITVEVVSKDKPILMK